MTAFLIVWMSLAVKMALDMRVIRMSILLLPLLLLLLLLTDR